MPPPDDTNSVSLAGPDSHIDFSGMLERLEHATPFELYRLHSALGRMLDDPARIAQAKRSVRVGDEIEHFDPRRNAPVRARVVRCKRTRAVVRNLDDGESWDITYCAINSDGVSTTIHERPRRGLGRNELSVGDRVGFVDRNRREHYGRVVKLNQKTVSVICDDDVARWRVAYGLLFRVLDADHAQHQTGVINALSYRQVPDDK
jgi:hypothetical protein